jgi:glycosyltransferase involved in cell wall biosynthesis
MFDGVVILKDRGLNVAYWNLNERPLTKVDGAYQAGKSSIVFFHFSGFNSARPKDLSKHQTRIKVSGYLTLEQLLNEYVERLKMHGHDKYRAIPYGFECLSNGIPISQAHRRKFADLEGKGVFFSDPFDAKMHSSDLQPGGARSLTGQFPPGINVAGYLTAELGIGEAARGYVRAIQEIGLDVALVDFSLNAKSRRQDETLTGFTRGNPYGVNLICVNADRVPDFISFAGEQYFEGRYNIGLWAWELPNFPDEWARHSAHFNEVWVGSSFMRESIAKALPIPVHCIPHVVQIGDFKKLSKTYFGLKEEEFTFLFIFDFHSQLARKNPIGLVHAFKTAFRQDEPVRLILKCINGDSDSPELKQMKDAIGDAKISILDQYLSRSEVYGLLDCTDCYISLHRSEGFGLTIAEAMFLEKPVIATGWSGNMDFMTNENSYPVDFTFVQLEEDYGSYLKGNVWVQPDIRHASQLMRSVYEKRDAAQEKGRQAGRDIRRQNSSSSIAKMIQGRLDEIKKSRRAFNGSRFSSHSKLLPMSAVKLPEDAIQEFQSASRFGKIGMLGRRMLERLFRFYIFHQNTFNRQIADNVKALQEKIQFLESVGRR